MKRLCWEIWLVPRNLAIAFMLLYRKAVSPLYGQVCRYYPSCSRYALEALQQHGLFLGFVRIIWRLVRCNPWTPGGIDDVSPGLAQRFTILPSGFVRTTTRKV